MKDCSRMRFVPIIKGYIKDEKKREKLYTHLNHQATSKAGEVKLSFNFRDITEEKSYFNGMSLEQIVHSMSTEADEEIPLVVKHITTRWSTRDKKMELELTVTSALVDEATKRLKTLRNDLMKKYGNEVRSHCIENGNKEARAWKTTPMKRKLPEITTN